MGEVKLKISADIQDALNGTEKLNKSVDELNKDTDQYNKRATAGFNQTGQAATQASQGVTKATQAFKIMGGAIAAAFSIGAIVQFGKAVVNSTEAGADAMERFKKGVESAFTFLRQSIATLDFTNLIQGFKNAYEAGKKFADQMDELEDRRRALSSQTRDIDLEIIRQRTLAKNRSLDINDRKAAIDEIIRLEELKLQKTKVITGDELKAQLEFAATNKKITEQQILDLVINYDLYAEKLKEGADLEDQLNKQVMMSRRASNVPGTFIYLTTYEEEFNKLNQTQKDAIILNQEYNKVVKEQRDIILAASNADKDATIALASSQETLQRVRNGIESELLAQEEKKAKADKERTKTTIEENLKSLDNYIEEANKKIFDIELGFGGVQTVEQFQKQIEDNLKSFNEAMADNPMFSAEDAWDAQEWDKMLAEIERGILELEGFAKEHPFWEALGLTSEEQIKQIEDFAKEIYGVVNKMVDQQVEARERLVDDWNQKIDEQEQLVEREQEDKAEGLANNYDLEKQNLANMQKARDAALKDREKWIQIQRNLSMVESAIALTTTIANIMKGFSTIPIVGWALGLLAVGAMITGFIAANAKVKDVTQMAEGGQAKHGMLRGKRHSQGGIPVEAEDKEWFINRKSSIKYSPLLDAINRDDLSGMKLFFDRKFVNKMPNIKGFDIDKSKKLGEIVRELKKGKAEITYGNGFIIERVGGYTKKINLN